MHSGCTHGAVHQMTEITIGAAKEEDAELTYEGVKYGTLEQTASPKPEADTPRPAWRTGAKNLLMIVIYYVIGCLFFCYHEDWSVATACYFITASVTT